MRTQPAASAGPLETKGMVVANPIPHYTSLTPTVTVTVTVTVTLTLTLTLTLT